MDDRDEKLLIYSTADLARVLGRSLRSVYIDTARRNWHRVPPPARLGRRLAWDPAQVRQWLAERLAVEIEKSEKTITPEKTITSANKGEKAMKNPLKIAVAALALSLSLILAPAPAAQAQHEVIPEHLDSGMACEHCHALVFVPGVGMQWSWYDEAHYSLAFYEAWAGTGGVDCMSCHAEPATPTAPPGPTSWGLSGKEPGKIYIKLGQF